MRPLILTIGPNFRRQLLQTVAILLLVLGLSIFARAQQSPAANQAPATSQETVQNLPSYQGQNVVILELAGRPDLNTDSLMPLVTQRAGQPFDQAKIDESIGALKKAGKFQTVRLEVLPVPNGVRVLFILEPALYFGMFEFPGAWGRFSYSRLLQVTNYPPEAGPFSRYDLEQTRGALEKFFQRNGFFLAHVEPRLQIDQTHGIVNVYFETSLNKRAKFGNVTFDGVSAEEDKHLHDVLTSIIARLRGSSIRPGKTYALKRVQNATQYLQKTLIKQAHLAAQVKLIGATYDPETNRADIAFHVQPGPIVHVKVEGAHIWSWTKKKLLPVYQQAGVDPELIQEGRQNLISHFQKKGYFDVRVTEQTLQASPGETILYRITKGPRHKVGEVSIAGNQHIETSELMPHVAVKPKHLLSHGQFSQALVHESVTNLSNIYRAAGYSSVKVTPHVTTSQGGNIAVSFRVDEGQRDIVDSLKIEGNDTLTQSQFAPKGLKVSPGQPYSQKLVNEDRNQIMANYFNQGFLTATFRVTARTVDNDPHRVAVVYRIMEGPQVRTADVVALGNTVTQRSVLDRSVDVQSGHPLREDQMLGSESRLYNLGIFDWAEVDPRRRITTQTQEDVLIKVHESKRNQITYGFGFEVINRGGSVPGGTVVVPGVPPVGLPNSFKTSQKTFWGPRGSFEYIRKNLRGRAESLSLSGLAGRLEQRGSITYQNPYFRGTNWTANTTISGEHNSENPIFTSRFGEFGFQLQRPLNPDRSQTLFLRYDYRQTGLTRLLIPDLVPSEDLHVRLSTVSATYLRDTRDNPLDAHKGIYESLQFDINPSALGSSVDFARLQGQTAYYKNIRSGIIWANSIRLGLEKPFAGSHVPLSEKFFSGGGSTLRGYPLNGAGPQRTIAVCSNPAVPSTCAPITVPQGGNELLILNSEFRFPLTAIMKNLGFVTFYDGGNVFRTIGFHGQYTNSVGVGLRYSTPVGPVRIDIGHNLNAPPGIKATQVFITLGQAF